MTKLREMAGLNDTQTNDSEVNALRQEAELPIHELMSKLKEVCDILFPFIFLLHLFFLVNESAILSVCLCQSFLDFSAV
jgi:hypothetical protein